MNPLETVISTAMRKVAWSPTGQTGDGLYATHEGIIDLGGMLLKVYRLNDGQEVFDAKSAFEVILGPGKN